MDEQCAGLIDSSQTVQPDSAAAATKLAKRQRNEIQIVQTPGCHESWVSFKRSYLLTAYSIAFTLVPLTLGAFVVGVLATNHIYD